MILYESNICCAQWKWTITRGYDTTRRQLTYHNQSPKYLASFFTNYTENEIKKAPIPRVF